MLGKKLGLILGILFIPSVAFGQANSVVNWQSGTTGTGAPINVPVSNPNPMPVTCASGCAAPSAATHAQTAALASNLVVKASAGTLTGFAVSADSTLSGAAWWLMVFDATSLPGDGAVTPALCYAYPSGTTSASYGFTAPVSFTTGIVLGVSTTGCFSKTASTHAFISAAYK
jgi:hypothetical protein